MTEPAQTQAQLHAQIDQLKAQVKLLQARLDGEGGAALLHQTQIHESLGLLAGGIAHDFNNLLTGVLGNAELALMELADTSIALPYIASISESAIKAAALCRQMLAFAGMGHKLVDALDLNSIISTVDHLLEAAVSKKVRLRYELCQQPITLEADASQVQQLLIQLVSNAGLAFGDAPGEVVMRTRHLELNEPFACLHGPLPPGPYICLEIEDSGCGMEPATQARAFDPYTSFWMRRGMGLAMVSGIVRSHQGGLILRSEPRLGTLVQVLLPRLVAQAHPQSTSKPCEGAGQILLVDDEAQVREVTRIMLERLGFEVLQAECGKQALALAAENRATLRLVLLDLSMPDLSGDQVMVSLRAISAGLPVILSSGFHESELAERFGDQGFSGFLQKPFRLATLRSCVAQALEISAPEPSQTKTG